jgi:DNA-binding NarL/FixJ family response regulator
MTSGAGITVVIAHGDPRVRRALRALMDSARTFTVAAEATSFDEAGTHVDRWSPSLVLLDLQLLPSASGLELLGQLTTAQGRVVVAMSTQSGLRDMALQAGAAAFVDPGATPDEILDALCRASMPVEC